MLRRIDKQSASVGLGLGSVERVELGLALRSGLGLVLFFGSI